jgi:hypothetical protein
MSEEEMLLWQLHFARKTKLEKEEMEKVKRKGRAR